MCVSGHAQVGGAALAAALGLGSSHVGASGLLHAAPRAPYALAHVPHAVAHEVGIDLAFTGSNHLLLLATIGALLVLVGLLALGMVRRHGGWGRGPGRQLT